MQTLEAIGCTGDHEARLARRQVINAIYQTLDVSWIVTLSLSPWFMSKVSPLGVNVAFVALAGPAGPVGTPFIWMKAKFVGSVQLGLQKVKPKVHSALLICSEAHQWVVSQLICVMNGEKPGG